MDEIRFAPCKKPYDGSPTSKGFNHGFKEVRNGFRNHPRYLRAVFIACAFRHPRMVCPDQLAASLRQTEKGLPCTHRPFLTIAHFEVGLENGYIEYLI